MVLNRMLLGMAIASSAHAGVASAKNASPVACDVVASANQRALCGNYARKQCPQNPASPGCKGLANAYFRASGGDDIQSLFVDSVDYLLPPSGNTLIFLDLLEIHLPGFESEQLVTISRVRSPELADRIQRQPDLFTRETAPYQLIIDTGSRRPVGQNPFELNLRIPDGWFPAPQGKTVQVVMLLESQSDMDERRSFEHIEGINRFRGDDWLVMTLPPAAFVRNEQGNHVATLSLVLADTPTNVTNNRYPMLAPLAELGARTDFGFSQDPATGEQFWHAGVDYAAPAGTDILAPADGVVVFSGVFDEQAGNMLLIRHARGWTQYLHLLHAPVLSVNDQVMRGQVIGQVGSSGDAAVPHLHFEFKSPDLRKRDPTINYILNGAFRAGTYEWDCGGERTGFVDFSADFEVLGHGRFQPTLHYLGASIVGQASVGPLAADETMPVRLISPGTDTIAYNEFSGIARIDSMSGSALNGDSSSPPPASPGCSAIEGPSGLWSLEQVADPAR